MGDLMVVALDFGTTYSCYAYSTRHEYKTDPTKIYVGTMEHWGRIPFMPKKTRTCLLLNEHGKFKAFGYNATNLYLDALLDGEQDQYYYFQRFKVNLDNNKNITSGMVLEDVIGKTLPAFEVFNQFIKALFDHVNECLGRRYAKHEIQWVLTVPAMWTDAAKQFMKSSAEKAGINPDRLILALKSETAFIWCQHLLTNKHIGTEPGFTMPRVGTEPGFTMPSVGTEYMVVHLGGETADITFHQKVANGQFTEKYRATGKDCGGTSVDRRFLRLFEEIVGKQLMDTLQKEDCSLHVELLTEFEAAKIAFAPLKRERYRLILPSYVALDEKCEQFHCKTLTELIASSKYSNEVRRRYDRLYVTADLIRGLLKTTVDNIILLMKDSLRSKMTKGVKQILMVGGFSECQIVQDTVRENFPDQRIIIPQDAGLSVSKGAVLYGHLLSVMRNSYGIKTYIKFNPRKFDEKNKVHIDGIDYCDNIFSKIVDKDDYIEAGTVVKRSYITPERNQEKMEFKVYVSEFQHPSFVNEIGCSELCKSTITFDDICDEQRWVDVEFIIGNTEIRLKAVDRNSGKEITAEFNLI